MAVVNAVVMILGRGRDHAAPLGGTRGFGGPAMAVHQAVVVAVVVHDRLSLSHLAIAGCLSSRNCAVSVECSIAVVEERPPEAAMATASK